MPRIAFITEFDGTDFAGFQSQENARAVQDVLEKALEDLYKTKIRLTGCSRTDAGVHAKCHLSHADVPFVIPEDKFPLAMNALLPDDVAVKKSFMLMTTFPRASTSRARDTSTASILLPREALCSTGLLTIVPSCPMSRK